jgi:hypothetical protein
MKLLKQGCRGQQVSAQETESQDGSMSLGTGRCQVYVSMR